MKKLCAALISVIYLAGLTQASVLTVSPAADSYIRVSDTASSTHGAEIFMVTNNGTGSGKLRWSFIRFDLSGITEPVVGVKLELQATKDGNNFPALSHAVYGLTTGESWTEAGLNYINAPARSGSTVNMAGVYGGAALSTFSYAGVVSGNAGGPVAAIIDQAAGGPAVDFIKADSDQVITFIIARTGTVSDSGVAWATRNCTYTGVAKPLLTVYTGTVTAPTPSNGQGLAADPASPLFAPVVPSQMMSWQAVSDPNIDPGTIRQYRLYMDSDKTNVETAAGCQYFRDFAAGTSYDPVPDLAYETNYYWRVDTKLKWIGQTDPNIITGNTWTFKTASALPTILTDPVSLKVKATEPAAFTVAYQSSSAIDGVVWYKNDSALPSTGVTWNQTSSTLTIPSMSAADEGSYYCVVANLGGTIPSAAALLAEKKVLAWYQFEQNAADSAGIHHGTEAGPAMAYASGTVLSGGQAYAADPNGGNYILLSTDAYPKAGFGSGLEEGTFSGWIKISPDAAGSLLGTYNGTANPIQYVTGFQVQVQSSGKLVFHVRDEDGSQGTATSNKVVDDNEWHYVTAVLTPAGITLYVDVTDKASAAATLDHYAAWQNPVVLLANNNRGTVESRFAGMADDLKICNYAWSQEEAAREYYRVTGIASCLSPQQIEGYDLNHDCQVNLGDFVLFTETWLQSGLYPVQ